MFCRTSEHNLIVDEPDHCHYQLNKYFIIGFVCRRPQVQRKHIRVEWMVSEYLCHTDQHSTIWGEWTRLFVESASDCVFQWMRFANPSERFCTCGGKYVHNQIDVFLAAAERRTAMSSSVACCTVDDGTPFLFTAQLKLHTIFCGRRPGNRNDILLLLHAILQHAVVC